MRFRGRDRISIKVLSKESTHFVANEPSFSAIRNYFAFVAAKSCAENEVLLTFLYLYLLTLASSIIQMLNTYLSIPNLTYVEFSIPSFWNVIVRLPLTGINQGLLQSIPGHRLST